MSKTLLEELEALVNASPVDIDSIPDPPGPVDETLATKLRGFADGLSVKIADLFRDRGERTNKQRSQASKARFDGHNLRAGQDALNALADGWDAGTVPELCRGYKSRKSVLDAVSVGLSRQSQGFHDLIYPDVDNPRDKSPEAVALRQFVSGEISAEDRAEQDREMTLKRKLAEARTMNIPGFFPTPKDVIDIMIDGLDLDGKLILEPSAGLGDIADRVAADGGNVRCVERQHSLVEILNLKQSTSGYATVTLHDFLEVHATPIFDYVLMNPPFENNDDITHVRHAFSFLKPCGELRAIMGAGSARRDANKKKIREFHEWLDDANLDYSWTELPAASFKNAFRSTGVSCWMLSIWKG